MIARTLYFGNPAYLSGHQNQLKVNIPETDIQKSIPIEDIGIVILDHPQITITQVLIAKLLETNVALITCNEKHLPTGLMLNLDGHSLQSRNFQNQIKASEPLKKQLWQKTIYEKVRNQANVLSEQGKNDRYLKDLLPKIKSGDRSNVEALAASFYWKSIFMELGSSFSRSP